MKPVYAMILSETQTDSDNTLAAICIIEVAMAYSLQQAKLATSRAWGGS